MYITRMTATHLKDIDINEITFTELSQSPKTSITSSFVNYKGGPFFMKLKNVKIPFGAGGGRYDEPGKNLNLAISTSSMTEEEFAKLEKINDLVYNFGKNNLKKILKDKYKKNDKNDVINEELYKSHYYPFIIYPKKNGEADNTYPPTFKTSLRVLYNTPDKYDLDCYLEKNKNKIEITKDNVASVMQKGLTCDVILKSLGIKSITGKYFGMTWKVMKIKLHTRSSGVPDFSDDEEEDEDEKTETWSE